MAIFSRQAMFVAFAGTVGMMQSADVFSDPLYVTNLGRYYVGSNGLNDLGHVVASGGSRGNFIFETGGIISLGEFDPVAINNKDQVVGFSSSATAAVWSNGAVAPVVSDSPNVLIPMAINDFGAIAGIGVRRDPLAPAEAFKVENGHYVSLGRGYATDINNAGTVVGSDGAIDSGSATVWKNGTSINITRPYEWGDYAFAARNITDSGVVASTDTYGSFLWKDGAYQDLPTSFWAFASNDSGLVIGSCMVPGASFAHGCIYRDGVLTDVNALLPEGTNHIVDYLTAVNSSGQMVATTREGDTLFLSPYAAVLQVPEPSESIMLAIGGLMFAGVIRKKRTGR